MRNTFAATIPLRGDLRIVVRRADSGAVHWRYEIRNTITYVALRSLVNLISQKTTVVAADYAVKYLRVGGYPTGFPVAMVPPTRSDINIQLPLSLIASTYISLGDTEKTLSLANPFEMKVNATLAATELNGTDLTEAGLFIRGTTTPTIPAPPVSPAQELTDLTHYPELFARQIHPAIPKSAAFVVDYDWRIAFTS
jgi:hypothetical protein